MVVPLPGPVQVWSVDLTPRPPLWWWKGAFLLIATFTYLLSYLVSYLLTVTPRSPLWWWKGAHLLSYLLNYLVTYVATYLLAYLLTY